MRDGLDGRGVLRRRLRHRAAASILTCAAFVVPVVCQDVSEEFRLPVVLRDLCDLDYAEIAERLAIPPGTVRSRIARGRAQLAALLDPGNQASAAERPTPRNDPGTAP